VRFDAGKALLLSPHARGAGKALLFSPQARGKRKAGVNARKEAGKSPPPFGGVAFAR